MISCAFVNGGHEELYATSPYIALQEFMVESEIYIHDAITEFMNLSAEYTAESAINGEDSEKVLMLESEGKNIFAKIGDKIIKLWETVISFISSCIDKIKDKIFESKSDLDKLEIMCKKHPSLKEEIINAYNDNKLNVSSMKSLAELEKTYDEIVKMSKNAEVKPGSMQDKWNKAVKAFEKAEKSGPFVIAGTIVSGMSLYKAISSFKGDCLKIKNNLNDYKKKANEHKDDMYKIIEEMKGIEGVEYVNDKMGRLQVLYRANKYMSGEYSAAAGKSAKSVDKITDTFYSILDKFEGKKKRKQFHSDVKTGNDMRRGRSYAQALDKALEKEEINDEVKRRSGTP